MQNILKPNNQKDRFVSSTKHHPSSFYHFNYEPVEKFQVNGNTAALDTDTQLIKLYKSILLESSDKENSSSPTSKICSSSQAPNQSIQEEWKQMPTRADLLSEKFHINPEKIMSNPISITKSEKILEAQSLSDNFYLNLLDCSQVSSVLGVALSKGVYLWKPQSNMITRIRQITTNQLSVVNSIKWHPQQSTILACGSKNGNVQIWDSERNQMLECYEQHDGRAGVLAWGQGCLFSGSKDSKIMVYDLRSPHKVESINAHEQQVCSLGVNSSQQYLASGSNDKNVHIWSLKYLNRKKKSNLMTFKHLAAIKALAWHPTKKNVLATGGGTQDRQIRIFNTGTKQLVTSQETGSQVCNLLYMKDGSKIVSSHGFNKYQTNIWSFKEEGLKKEASLVGHTKRVLYLTMENSYSGNIVTGAGDQTIRFWKNPFSNGSRKPQKEQNIMSLR